MPPVRYKCAPPPDEWAHVCFTWETTEQEAELRFDDPPEGQTRRKGRGSPHAAAVAVAAGI